jgi:O-antigen/teichoic acid export membrane protein
MENLRNRIYRALRRSEILFKTDMVYLAKGAFWLNFGHVSTMAVSFVLSLVLANFLTQHNYGVYKYIISLSAIVGIFSISGIKVAVTRAVARGFEGELVRGAVVSLKWGLLVTLISGFGAFYYFLNENLILAWGLIIIGVFLPLLNSAEIYNSFLNGKKDFRLISFSRIWNAIFSSLALIITTLYTQNPLALVATFYISHFLGALATYYLVFRKYKPNSLTDSETLSLAKHSSVINNFSAFADQIDSVLVFHFLGAAPLAIYNFATIVPMQLAGLIKNIGPLATPKFSQGDKEEAKKTLGEKSFKIFLSGAVMTLGYILIAPFLFKFFFPLYVASIPYSQVYSLILMISASLPVALLDAHMAIKEKYIVSSTSNVIKILFLVLGFYLFGLWGIIMGKVLGKSFAYFFAYHAAKRV